MSAAHETLALLRSARADLIALIAERRFGDPALGDELEAKPFVGEEELRELDRALVASIEILAAVRPVCRYCGRPNDRRGDFCSDAHRTAFGREHSPEGRIVSIRPLIRASRSSVTVRFEAEELDRVMRLRTNQHVHLVGAEEEQR